MSVLIPVCPKLLSAFCNLFNYVKEIGNYLVFKIALYCLFKKIKNMYSASTSFCSLKVINDILKPIIEGFKRVQFIKIQDFLLQFSDTS